MEHVSAIVLYLQIISQFFSGRISNAQNQQAVPFGTFLLFFVPIPRVCPAGTDTLGFQQIPLSGEGGVL